MHALHLLTRKCVRGNGFRIIENGDDSVDGRQKVGVRVRLFARFVARRMRWRHAPTYEERFEIVFFYELFLVCKRIRNEEIPNSGNIFGSITFIPLRSREARANRFTFRRDPECMRMNTARFSASRGKKKRSLQKREREKKKEKDPAHEISIRLEWKARIEGV